MNSIRSIPFRTKALIAVATLLACSDGGLAPDALENEFATVLTAGGNMLSEAVNADATLLEGEPVETDLGGGSYQVCTSRRVSAMRAGGGPAGFPLFDPAAGVIYPGSLLQGATLRKAPPDPVAVRRAPGVVAINIVNGSQGVYREVSEVTQAQIVQAMNDIVASNTGVLPANFTMSVHDARSREQFSLGLGVDINTAFVSVEGRFNMRTDRQYSRLLVKLTQSYYTMSFQLPAAYSDLFAPEVTPADLARQVGDGNPATYISDVTYGRIYYMLVESTSSQLELSAALEASFDRGLVDGQINAEFDLLRTQSELNVSVFALGGEAGATIRTFGETNLADLVELFAESSDIRTGVPLSYVVRNVVDNRIVATQLATEYDVVDCQTYSDMFRNPAFRFDAVPANLNSDPFTLVNGDTPQYLSSWVESVSGTLTPMESRPKMFEWISSCLGSTNINTTKVKNAYAGIAMPAADGPNGNGFVRYHQHRTPGLDGTAHPFSTQDSVIHVFPWHRFDGRALEDTSFTIFAVVRSTADSATLHHSGGHVFLFTNERADYHAGARQTMTIGFNWTGNIEMHFRSYGGVQRRAPNRTRWAVYAFRFSTLEGMSVYVDNVSQKTANTLKDPLIAFRGASIGFHQARHFTSIVSANLSEDRCWRYGYGSPQPALDIAFLEAFSVAASDTQIGERMSELATRFGIF
ncbi:MAG: thiol-activated cytolysin family protein [Gemmatimonadaceae bacterium]